LRKDKSALAQQSLTSSDFSYDSNSNDDTYGNISEDKLHEILSVLLVQRVPQFDDQSHGIDDHQSDRYILHALTGFVKALEEVLDHTYGERRHVFGVFEDDTQRGHTYPKR
jgi:hypothetical protein